MALTTLDGVIAGLRAPTYTFKTGVAATDGRHMTSWYVGAIPAGATANAAGASGAALTYPVTGSIPWTPPGSGDTVLARYLQRGNTATGTAHRSSLLIDRLWHNSGLNATLTTAQTVNSVTLPARDVAQTTNGDGVLIGLEVSTASTVNTPTVTISYTNSAGTAGRTATNIAALTATSAQGSFYIIGLQAGDTGVQSIQSITLSVGWTSAVVHLVLFRPIAHMPFIAISNGAAASQGSSMVQDVIGLAAPKIFEGSVLQVLGLATGNVAPTTTLTLSLSSG
jgi:hypothetical protein